MALSLGMTPLLVIPVRRLFWPDGSPVADLVIIFALGLVVWGLAAFSHRTQTPAFPCPRCRRTFFGDKLFPKKPACHHCGLPYGAPCDPDATDD